MNLIGKGFMVFGLSAVISLAGPRSFAGPGRFTKMVEDLGLSAEQKAKLQKIQAQYYETLPGKREKMNSAHEDLQEALRGAASEKECRKKFKELERKQEDFSHARFDKVLAVRSILTPEQRRKFKAYDEKSGETK